MVRFNPVLKEPSLGSGAGWLWVLNKVCLFR
jgi:hypothetical protein